MSHKSGSMYLDKREKMKEKMKTIGKLAPLALILAMVLVPFASAATNSTTGDLDTAEGGVLAGAVFFFFVGVAAIFWLLPQRKEKKAVPVVIGVGVAIAVMAVIFYFTSFLTGYNIAFWTEYLDWAGHSGTILTGVAGDFLILMFGAYKIYVEKNSKKERDIILLMLIGMTVWSVVVLLPALIGFSV